MFFTDLERKEGKGRNINVRERHWSGWLPVCTLTGDGTGNLVVHETMHEPHLSQSSQELLRYRRTELDIPGVSPQESIIWNKASQVILMQLFNPVLG